MNEAKLVSAGEGRFEVIGGLNFETAVSLLKQSESQFDAAQSLVIDLGQVTETDSAGLALVIEWLRLARQKQRKLQLVNLPQPLIALARISEVEELLGTEAASAA